MVLPSFWMEIRDPVGVLLRGPDRGQDLVGRGQPGLEAVPQNLAEQPGCVLRSPDAAESTAHR